MIENTTYNEINLATWNMQIHIENRLDEHFRAEVSEIINARETALHHKADLMKELIEFQIYEDSSYNPHQWELVQDIIQTSINETDWRYIVTSCYDDF